MASSVASIASRSRRTERALVLWLSLAAVGAGSCGTDERPMEEPRAEAQVQAEALQLPYYSTPEFTAEWPEPGARRPARAHRVGAFALQNQDGVTVTNELLRGKIYVANFFFTKCQGICPKMLKHLRLVQDAFAADADVALLSHTVMPAVDSREVLSAYARDNGIRSGKWHLLTGARDTIYDLARRSYFAEKSLGLKKGKSEFLHTENLLLIDQAGRIRGIYNGTLPVEAERLIADIRLLQAER